MALLAARLTLAVVFGSAGLAKLVDRSGSRRALADFGVPRCLTAPGAVLLPVAELAVAAALLGSSSAWVGATGALVLLAAFSVAIAAQLVAGKAPDCHCFGRLRSTPVGPVAVLRNAALAVLALLVVGWEPVPGRALAWPGDPWPAAGLALLGLCVVAGWFIHQRVRHQGRLRVRLDAVDGRGDRPGLALGAAAPAFALPTMSGETSMLEEPVATGQPVVLFFTDPHCGPCRVLLPEIGRWQRQFRGVARLTVVSVGDSDENRERTRGYRLDPSEVLLDDGVVAHAYHVDGTPSAVLIGADRRIASPVAMGAEAIRRLVDQATGAIGTAPGSSGRPAEEPVTSRRSVLRAAAVMFAAGVAGAVGFSRPTFADPKPPVGTCRRGTQACRNSCIGSNCTDGTCNSSGQCVCSGCRSHN